MYRQFCRTLLISFFCCMLTGYANAQDDESGKRDRESLIRATRIMKKIDQNGNGTFEKQESASVWNRYRRLDVNRDQVISIDELLRERLAQLESDGERKLNMVYKQTPQGDLLLDLYYPAGTSDPRGVHPIVVYTHGGGWAAGSKQGIANGSFKVVFEELLGHGFAVASVSYRLYRSGGEISMRDCVIDAKDAVRYLAKNCDELKLDADRVFVMGDSAGGQMAQMLLLSSPESLPGDQSLASATYNMVAGVSWYGPCDFENTDLFNHDDSEGFRDRFGARILKPDSQPDQKLTLYREMSPINYLSPDSPPLLMIQGDQDTTIPVKHAYYMKQKADVAGAPVEIMIIKNAGHNWRKVGSDIEPSRDAIIQRTVKFFTDRL